MIDDDDVDWYLENDDNHENDDDIEDDDDIENNDDLENDCNKQTNTHWNKQISDGEVMANAEDVGYQRLTCLSIHHNHLHHHPRHSRPLWYLCVPVHIIIYWCLSYFRSLCSVCSFKIFSRILWEFTMSKIFQFLLLL